MKQKKFWVFCSLVCMIGIVLSVSVSAQRCFKSIEQAKQSGKCVECLDLSKNRLKQLPPELFEFKDLRKLILSRNSLSDNLDSLSLLTKLTYLDLSSNYIETLPESLACLPIDSLIMWDNPCRNLPQELSKWNLRYLDMRAIQMTRKEQKAIKLLFPLAKIRMDHPCNCGSGR